MPEVWSSYQGVDGDKVTAKPYPEYGKMKHRHWLNELLSYMAIIIFPIYLLLFLISHMLNKQHSQEWYDNHYG